MIKYLGSKRRLVPLLAALAEIAGGSTALDLFTGTTRVAQAFRQLGRRVTAVDTARVLRGARPYVRRDWAPSDAEARLAADTLAGLDALRPEAGYVTETFCVAVALLPSRQRRPGSTPSAPPSPRDHAGSWLEPVLLTSLLEAADRVDSTTGLQMAYLKQWAPRAHQRLELRAPELPAGPSGRAVRATRWRPSSAVGSVDLAYLDPPYNQHRYFTNYHVWETLVALGRTRPTTAWPASGSTLATRPPAASSTIERRMPEALRRLPGRRATPGSWSSRTTTRRGCRSTSS